ncbi:hypothetical protein LJ707_11030 [Mucilaginibacter sp. UR6-1]|uniref:hypothetical protein n=1 Tax=Mucilaginibacter sp. UR6-1 TaxID=1435643 RepID=UPI001E304D14|nr:hypothetical protein [Mucilaginibacter sp. UR6-1]MCC8409466.1 hypothetical protein [Mucilaginibacter sp. UR6-1]
MKQKSPIISGSFLFLLGIVACLSACKKEKLDNTPLQTEVGNNSASAIRLFNLATSTDVTVNNIPLTARQNNGQNQGSTDIGLSLFPSGKWLSGEDGAPFVLPNNLLDKNGKAHFIIGTLDTTIVNNVENPRDYYLMANGHLRVVERNNTQPAASQNFKIRVINYGSQAFGNQLELDGPVTLTYADGSVVDQRLSNIAPGASSGYIELPYGAYQFKLFVASGGNIDVTKQLADVPTTPYYDPCNPSFHPQQGINPRVRTFKPGGVYTIMISENRHALYSDCAKILPPIIYANSYRVLTESNPGVNNTFARMQAINALPGKTISVSVDGKALGGTYPYIGQAAGTKAYQADYQIYVQGKHHIVARDEGGSLLAEADLTLYPYDNYTIWLYNNGEGKPELVFQPNDMTGTLYSSTYHPNGPIVPDDGTNGAARLIQYPYALQSRFINLCADVPFATFTNDHQLLLPAIGPNLQDSIRYFSAYVNMKPGALPLRNASVIYSLPNYSPASTGVPFGNTEKAYLPSLIRVFRSKPAPQAEVPGSVEQGVLPIQANQAFIANSNLYSFPQFKSPETGIYTVALVGRMAGSVNGAKLMVIKHNK